MSSGTSFASSAVLVTNNTMLVTDTGLGRNDQGPRYEVGFTGEGVSLVYLRDVGAAHPLS
ncbi:hypothetical protein MycrhN_5515 [Mycolicibacterium rhodesiae NBB3]|uniref:Uncharacterized protein n=1 Tax=Mycolicibacterium rhodesiae (strain NBB3) TaxID=710685 RepID=G8RJP3_MYCRN|nr:hypothetical protein MycrhN_5515 [Mycolicibacterium rhodesiae NBB3]